MGDGSFITIYCTLEYSAMPKINDLDLKRWKQYEELLTDSLWLIDERSREAGHSGEYHGNFVPQIPRQLMQRFTKKGDVVLDLFLGSGTTLIEADRLGRKGIGVELLPRLARKTQKRTRGIVVAGDSARPDTRLAVEKALKKFKKKLVQLLVMHPPYHDIIKFSTRKDDLSNAVSVEQFVQQFGAALDNFLDLLERHRYVAVVIGDKYTNSEWVPLGFYLMQEVMKRPDVILKSVIVKNMAGNRAKRNLEKLWRYRALKGGFYVFKHEYILLFQKT